MTPESNNRDDPLTIVDYTDGGTRRENSANPIKASDVRGIVLDLKAETKSVSKQVYQVTRRVIHLCTQERWVGVSGTGDGEGVLGGGV